MFQGEGHSRRGPKFNTVRCHFESYLAVKMYNETSGRVTWALKNKPTLPDRWSRYTFWRHGQAARLLSTIQNGGAQSWILALFGEEFQWDRMRFRS